MSHFTYDDSISKEEVLKIRTLFSVIKTEPANNVWVRIKRWKYKSHICSGQYKSIMAHRLTQVEQDFIDKFTNIEHIIILRIGDKVIDCYRNKVMSLIAHEYAHLLQFHDGSPRNLMCKRAKERHANKWAEYRLKQLSVKS
jgi:hypothetical protein